MSLVVYKYRLPALTDPFMDLPKGAKFLHVDSQEGIPMVWVLVDPDQTDKCRRHIEIFATGQTIESWPEPNYLGTFKLDWTVWHVFTSDAELPLNPNEYML